MSKYALVTGGSRGIGRAISLTLAQDGYDILVNYNKDDSAAEKIKKEIETLGRKCFLFKCDLTHDASVIKMFKDISTKVDKLDVLVNNAGYDYAKLIEDYSMEEIRYVIDLVLTAKIHTAKLALKLLRKSDYASIINIASRMGKEKTIPTIGAYGPAEAGVIKFTQCSALEFKDNNIRVNCVAPGLTRTQLTEDLLSDDEFLAAGKANPLGRVGKPEDIANVVSFLVSRNADYINGETIGVNGGSNLG
jgi:3-oxoacyl-[acyl-carrier protein] reductase